MVHPDRQRGAAHHPSGGYAMKRASAPIPFAGSLLDETRHVCAFMRTHPMVIIGGILQHNPFFVPPEEFLREFRHRRAHRNNPPAAA
jgi:hypothetical protein